MIDKKRCKAVRVVPRAEVMAANKKTDFFQNYRMRGIPPTQVSPELVEPLVDRVLSTREEQPLQASEMFDCSYQKPPYSFDSLVCEECTETIVEKYRRLKNGKKVCFPRAEKK